MTVLAISLDAPEDSRAFAAAIGAWFPLLSDRDGAVARVYAGMSADAAALPGVTVIGRDGRIAFRHVASEMDDRVDAAELLAILDRTVGTTGPAAVGPGFAALDRVQLALSLGPAALLERDATHASAIAVAGVLVPFGRHVLLGPSLRFEPRSAPIAIEGALVVRAPFAGNLAALQLAVTGGYSPFETIGWTTSARAGVWFAYTPSWALTFDVEAARLPEHHLELFATVGVAKLIPSRP